MKEKVRIDDIEDILANADEGFSGNHNPSLFLPHDGSDLGVVNHSILELYVENAYRSKKALLIYGDAGIGKSQSVAAFARKTAERKGKRFMDWTRSTSEEKTDMIMHPEKYFVLMDIRVNKLNPEDLYGIPDISSGESWMEFKPMQSIYFLTRPNADGLLFLDEINHGSPQILRALFEVVLDKKASERPFGKDIAIIAAGNLGDEHGNEPLPQALTARFNACVLKADAQDWISWASKNDINRFILAFVRADTGTNFYQKPRNPSDTFPNPRSMCQLSDAIKHIRERRKDHKGSFLLSELDEVGKAAELACGSHWAKRFITFMRYMNMFDITTMKENVKQVVNPRGNLGAGASDEEREVCDLLDSRSALIEYLVSKASIAAQIMIAGKSHPVVEQTWGALAHITIHLNIEWTTILWSNIKHTLPIEEFREIIIGTNDSAKKDGPAVFDRFLNIIKNDMLSLMKDEEPAK